MIRNILSGLIFISLFFALNFSTAVGTEFYNESGSKIDVANYEKIISARKSTIDQIQREGYGDKVTSLKDPILLRKKRMEQWELYRKSKR